MGMNDQTRRLTALEQLAETVRYRPHRLLAEARGLDPERVVDECKRAEAQRRQLRAAGMSDQQILELQADRMRISVAELRRRAGELQRQADALLERFS